MLKDFRHERENEVSRQLTENKEIQILLNTMHGAVEELSSFAELRMRNFHVTRKTHPRLYDLFVTAAERLEMKAAVPVYLSFEHKLYAEAIGEDDNCVIVISHECAEAFSDEQLLALFGYELAHIKYGHVRYLNLTKLIDIVIGNIPAIGQGAAAAAKTLLLGWRRIAEYTADRGASIAAGRMEPVMRNLIANMAGTVLGSEEGFRYQNLLDEDPEENIGEDMIGQIVSQVLLEEVDPPFGMNRIRELWKWSGSEACRKDFSYVYYNSSSVFGLDSMADGAAQYLEAKKYFSTDGKYGLALMHAAARNHSADALGFLGRSYLYGLHTLSKSEISAVYYLREAALMNHAEGLYGLGICFQEGLPSILPARREMADWLLCLADERGYEDAGNRANAFYARQRRISKTQIASIAELHGENGVKEEQAFREYLWIPAKEELVAGEALELPDGGQEWMALTPCAVYAFRGKGLPQRTSWTALLKGEMQVFRKGENTELLLNGKRFIGYQKLAGKKSIPQIIVSMKKSYERSG